MILTPSLPCRDDCVPQTSGPNLDLFSIYSDPLIIYIYIASIPFFIGLSQAFKLLTLIDASQAFSQGVVNTLKNMKYASVSLIGFIAVGLAYIRLFAHGDDPAGPTMLGICLSIAFAVLPQVYFKSFVKAQSTSNRKMT
jgi:predicted tellurium resistance membrane protein TerC